MTREQLNEAEKIIPLLNKCRIYLDKARFYMGYVPEDDKQYQKCSEAYKLICQAMDLF